MSSGRTISDEVLGTKDEFFQRVQSKVQSGDSTEQKLMMTSVKKYMQRDVSLGVGDPMVDFTVARIGEAGTTFNLSDAITPGRPLVLNYGSCS